MRLALAFAALLSLVACAARQSGAERSLLFGDTARAAQAALDAQIIMHGMAMARASQEFVARDLRREPPGLPVPPVTR